MDLEAVGRELYGLPPAEFTAARDTKAAEARRTGDRQLVAAIKQLKRPSASAWLANALVRERPERVEELLGIGERLREAQRRLAGKDLKGLARTGHRLVAELLGDAERLAAVRGMRPSASALRQLQETLDAAMADPEAGQALRAGRLTGALSYAGLGTFDGDIAPSAGAVDRERETVERVTADLHVAERRLAELSAELQSAHRRRDRLQDQMEDMERQLRQVRAQETDVDGQIRELEASVAAATQDIEDARSGLGGRD